MSDIEFHLWRGVVVNGCFLGHDQLSAQPLVEPLFQIVRNIRQARGLVLLCSEGINTPSAQSARQAGHARPCTVRDSRTLPLWEAHRKFLKVTRSKIDGYELLAILRIDDEHVMRSCGALQVTGAESPAPKSPIRVVTGLNIRT